VADTTSSTTPAAKTGFGFGGAASTTPFGAPLQQQSDPKPAESRPAFGGFGGSTAPQSQQPIAEKPAEQKSGFSLFAPQPPATTTTADQPKTGFGVSGRSNTTAVSDSKPTFGGFGQNTLNEKPAESKPAFGGPIQSTEKPAETKPAFGGFATAAKSSPWSIPSGKPTENKGFGFSSAPASVSTTPKPPEIPVTGGSGFNPAHATSTPATAQSGFAGFTAPSTDQKNTSQSDQINIQPKPFGSTAFALGTSTTGSSTAATSVSGDSTDTTPAPVKKDFASGFAGFTPSVTPASMDQDGKKGIETSTPSEKEEKKEEKTGFAGFAAFGAKKDTPAETEKKDVEKPQGFAGFTTSSDKRAPLEYC
jgi:hypothetical protein